MQPFCSILLHIEFTNCKVGDLSGKPGKHEPTAAADRSPRPQVGKRWGEGVAPHNHGVMWWRAAANLEAALGLARIVALYYYSSTSFTRFTNIFGTSILKRQCDRNLGGARGRDGPPRRRRRPRPREAPPGLIWGCIRLSPQ